MPRARGDGERRLARRDKGYMVGGIRSRFFDGKCLIEVIFLELFGSRLDTVRAVCEHFEFADWSLTA